VTRVSEHKKLLSVESHREREREREREKERERQTEREGREK
jgi:hypothetical protein